MGTDITFDLGQLDRLAKRLRTLGDPDAPAAIVEGLADLWVDTARTEMGYDTGQLYNRTGVASISGGRTRAEAWVEADTPYAGFHNYGNRYTPPNRFWNKGRDAAEREARRIGGDIETQLRRVLESGGVWNPRALFDR